MNINYLNKTVTDTKAKEESTALQTTFRINWAKRVLLPLIASFFSASRMRQDFTAASLIVVQYTGSDEDDDIIVDMDHEYKRVAKFADVVYNQESAQVGATVYIVYKEPLARLQFGVYAICHGDSVKLGIGAVNNYPQHHQHFNKPLILDLPGPDIDINGWIARVITTVYKEWYDTNDTEHIWPEFAVQFKNYEPNTEGLEA